MQRSIDVPAAALDRIAREGAAALLTMFAPETPVAVQLATLVHAYLGKAGETAAFGARADAARTLREAARVLDPGHEANTHHRLSHARATTWRISVLLGSILSDRARLDADVQARLTAAAKLCDDFLVRAAQ